MSSVIYSFINSVTNSITSRYDIKAQISSAGLWKIYQGERKTTGKKVALFIFDKRTLDTAMKRDRGSRQDTEAVYEILKKEAAHLARLRHPSILEVVEPVSESRTSIIFVTEPLMGSLTLLVKSSTSYSSDNNTSLMDLDEIEIQKGLLQVGKGLQFLKDVNVVHHNLTTDAVFVNAKGDWKIGGLGFSVFLNNGTPSSYDQNSDYLPDACQINMDYAAPEFILDNNICQENDMFSLGCLAYAVHNKGISLLKTFNNYHTYEKQVKSITAQSVSTMPVHLQDVIRSLLVRHPTQRMSAVEFQNSKYFDNLLVSTMKFMESFPEKTREEKAQFMKGLSKVLNQFPERVLKRKILPSLLEELKDAQLLPYTIPNIFLISEKLNQHEFCDIVLPALKPIFQVREPPQNMIVLLEKLDILQQKTPRETFRDDVMPLVYAALESPTALVQEKALRIIPSLSELLDYTAIKSSLFPRVQAVFVQTTILSVKVSTLICFHSIIKVLDKFTVQEKLVPLLKNIKTKEPAVMLATLAVYDEIGKIADKEIIATELLPQLWRMSFGPLLNLDQFQKFMKTIHSLTKKVEEAHLRHLKEIKSLEDQTRSVSATNTPQTTHISIGEDTPVSFESLVQNKKPSLENNRPTTSDDDMFSSLQGSAPQTNTWNNNKLNQPVLSPMSTSNTASWNSPNLAPSSIPNTNNILNNKWNSQFNQLPSNGQGWQMKTSPSLSNTNTISASAVNNSQNRQMTNSINWSTTTSIPSLVSPPSFQSTMNQMNQLSLNPTPSDNYNSLRTTPQQQLNNHVLMPLSSGMGLLQPTPNTQHTNPPKKHINIHAFDPLG